jgi:DNA-binding MurR/RpiR family transcriptional regulator
MQQVLEALLQRLPQLSPKLARAAKLIIDRPHMVATHSMRELAREAEVAAPTLLRLARLMGYDNYQDFRTVFRSAIENYNFEQRASHLQQASTLSGEASIIHALSDAGNSNLKWFYQQLDNDDICRAADLIINADTTYVIAAGAPYWVATYFQYVGKMAVPHLRMPRLGGDGLVEGLIPIREDDVIVALSYHPYAKETIYAIDFALSQGAKLVYLTDSLAAPMADRASVLIRQSTDSPQFFPSMLGAVAAIETLLAVIVARSGADAIGAIAHYADLRQQRYL